jgi:hypothetical protein
MSETTESLPTVQQIPAEDFGPIIDGHAWWIVDHPVRGRERPCRYQCISAPAGREWWDGYDTHRCDCIDGRHTFTVEVECDRCLTDARGYEMTGGAEWKLPDGRWVRACYSCGDPERFASPGSGFIEHRLSIVPGMILPIRDGTKPCADGSSHIRDDGPGYQPRNRWVLMLERKMGDYVTLPSGARPGRWAVQCTVAS